MPICKYIKLQQEIYHFWILVIKCSKNEECYGTSEQHTKALILLFSLFCNNVHFGCNMPKYKIKRQWKFTIKSFMLVACQVYISAIYTAIRKTHIFTIMQQEYLSLCKKRSDYGLKSKTYVPSCHFINGNETNLKIDWMIRTSLLQDQQ